MLQQLKVSTAATVTILMVDSTGHVAGKTGLEAGLTIYAAKNGANPGAITPTVAAVDGTNMPGIYSLALTTTHTNTVGELVLHITGAGADPTDVWYQIVTDLPGVAQTGDSYAIVNGTSGSVATKTAVDAIKTKTDFLPSVTAGNAGGVFIAGTNAATTITTALTTTFTGNLTGSIGSLGTTAKGDVNGEVVDCIGTDALTEIAQGVPSATPNLKDAIMLLYMALRNKSTTTSTEFAVYNDAGTKIAKQTLSDDTTTLTVAEMISGA